MALLFIVLNFSIDGAVWKTFFIVLIIDVGNLSSVVDNEQVRPVDV